MKFKLALLTAMTLPNVTNAFDYKFSLESRIDFKHQSLTKEDNNNQETKEASNSFEGSVVRLNLQGKLNDVLTYRARYRFNMDEQRSKRDKATGALDFAYLDHKNNFFTTRFGKTKIGESAGRESMVTSSELFLKTEAAELYDDSIGNYRFGVTAFYNFLENHKLTLSLFNPNPDYTDTENTRDNKSLAYGIYYSSKIHNAFQPVLSYELAAQDGDMDATIPTKDADYTMMAAGFKSEMVENLAFEFDWKQFKREAMTNTQADVDGKTTSLYSTLQYKMGEFTPFINYVNDKFKSVDTSANKDFKNNSYAVGTKWTPYNDLNLAYHVYYMTSKKEYNSNLATTQTEKYQAVVLGFKADI